MLFCATFTGNHSQAANHSVASGNASQMGQPKSAFQALFPPQQLPPQPEWSWRLFEQPVAISTSLLGKLPFGRPDVRQWLDGVLPGPPLRWEILPQDLDSDGGSNWSMGAAGSTASGPKPSKAPPQRGIWRPKVGGRGAYQRRQASRWAHGKGNKGNSGW